MLFLAGSIGNPSSSSLTTDSGLHCSLAFTTVGIINGKANYEININFLAFFIKLPPKKQKKFDKYSQNYYRFNDSIRFHKSQSNLLFFWLLKKFLRYIIFVIDYFIV